MRTKLPIGIAVLISIAVLSVALSGCSAEAPNADSADTGSALSQVADSSEVGDGSQTDTLNDNGENYAFGVGRDDLATAIETAFSSNNGKARWEGDRLILSVDGDINAAMPGFRECRVLGHLLSETDTASIEFPNGSITCEEALDY